MISIDYKSGLSIYEQIAGRFRTLILKGALPSGSQMPSVRTLAVELSINPNTIQKAYAMLEQQGYIYPVKGRGNFVSESAELIRQKKKEILERLEALVREGTELGIPAEEYIRVIRRAAAGKSAGGSAAETEDAAGKSGPGENRKGDSDD